MSGRDVHFKTPKVRALLMLLAAPIYLRQQVSPMNYLPSVEQPEKLPSVAVKASVHIALSRDV